MLHGRFIIPLRLVLMHPARFNTFALVSARGLEQRESHCKDAANGVSRSASHPFRLYQIGYRKNPSKVRCSINRTIPEQIVKMHVA